MNSKELDLKFTLKLKEKIEANDIKWVEQEIEITEAVVDALTRNNHEIYENNLAFRKARLEMLTEAKDLITKSRNNG